MDDGIVKTDGGGRTKLALRGGALKEDGWEDNGGRRREEDGRGSRSRRGARAEGGEAGCVTERGENERQKGEAGGAREIERGK